MQQFKGVFYSFLADEQYVTQTFNIKLARDYRTLITKSPTVGRVFGEHVAKFLALRDV